MKALRVAKKAPELKLDLGSGPHVREGFEGVDSRDFGQSHRVDLTKPWPWKTSSVDAANCTHFIEHLTASQRIHFVNELWRVMKPDATCHVITPHWCSTRAYGDLTHQWPPVSEMWFFYLDKAWRAAQAPHNDGYTCDFAVTWGYNLKQELLSRNQEHQAYAVANFKEAAMDIIATFTARK